MTAVTAMRISGQAQDGTCAAIELTSMPLTIGARKSLPLTVTLAAITMADESLC